MEALFVWSIIQLHDCSVPEQHCFNTTCSASNKQLFLRSAAFQLSPLCFSNHWKYHKKRQLCPLKCVYCGAIIRKYCIEMSMSTEKHWRASPYLIILQRLLKLNWFMYYGAVRDTRPHFKCQWRAPVKINTFSLKGVIKTKRTNFPLAIWLRHIVKPQTFKVSLYNKHLVHRRNSKMTDNGVLRWCHFSFLEHFKH